MDTRGGFLGKCRKTSGWKEEEELVEQKSQL